jgi:Kef-type K+ transport system membrane component KefB
MPSGTVFSLLVIAVVAVLAPGISDAIHIVRVPAVVIEILLGIIAGPQVLGLAHVTPVVESVSEFGLAFLFFVAGFEIDIERILGSPLRLALTGWAISLAIAFALGIILQLAGIVGSAGYIGLAIATTSLGTLLPMLRDAGEMESDFGKYFVAIGAVGEFGPILLAALVLSPIQQVESSFQILIIFIAVVLGCVLLARHWRPAWMAQLIKHTMRSSTQVAVRLSLLLLMAFIFFTNELNIEFLLGACGAGIIVGQTVKMVEPHAPEEVEDLRIKYEAIGFGLFIPIFFVVTGIQFDLDSLLAHASSLLLLPVCVLGFLVVRGFPALLLYQKVLPSPRARGALAILSATELPLVITITSLGVESGNMTSALAAALVGSAMLSVLIFPVAGMVWRRGQKNVTVSNASNTLPAQETPATSC